MRRTQSHSSIESYAACPRRYYLRYRARIARRERSPALRDGSTWHRLLELYHANATALMTHAEVAALMADATGRELFDLLARYNAEYPPIYGLTEYAFAVPFGAISYTGVIDLVTYDCDSGVATVWDHKLCGSAYTGRRYLYPQESPQLLGYAAVLLGCGYDRIDVGYNLAFRSSQGRRFRRIVEPTTRAQLEEWAQNTAGWIRRIAVDDTWPQNRASCRHPYRCEYLTLCEAGRGLDTLMTDAELEQWGYWRRPRRV